MTQIDADPSHHRRDKPQRRQGRKGIAQERTWIWFSERRSWRRFPTAATVKSKGRPENPFSVRPSDFTARCATAQRLRLGIADNSAVCKIHGS